MYGKRAEVYESPHPLRARSREQALCSTDRDVEDLLAVAPGGTDRAMDDRIAACDEPRDVLFGAEIPHHQFHRKPGQAAGVLRAVHHRPDVPVVAQTEHLGDAPPDEPG